jgi:MFS family permease
MFTFGSLLLTTGSPADRFGRKRIFASGMMLFVAFKPFCAGPTGVELAASIAQLVAATLRKNFRRIDPAKSRIVLLDGGARILPTFAQSLSRKAAKRLTKLGVEVSTGVKVEKV